MSFTLRCRLAVDGSGIEEEAVCNELVAMPMVGAWIWSVEVASGGFRLVRDGEGTGKRRNRWKKVTANYEAGWVRAYGKKLRMRRLK